MKETRTFEGLLNADDEANQLASKEYLRLVNMRFSESRRLESVASNSLITNTLAIGTNFCVGSCAEEQDKYLVFFVQNSSHTDTIWLFYQPTATFWKVLEGDLGFSTSTFVHCAIMNGIVYWLDSANEPRRINLAAAIKAQYSGSSPIPSDWQFGLLMGDTSEYSLIRRPPNLTGLIAKKNNGSYNNNFIANESFQFAYQYQYWDGEQSVLSAFTTASKLNTVPQITTTTYG
jgi:hypothetical protein